MWSFLIGVDKVGLRANYRIGTKAILQISLIISEIWILSSRKCSNPIVPNPGLLWVIPWVGLFCWLMRIMEPRLLRVWFYARR